MDRRFSRGLLITSSLILVVGRSTSLPLTKVAPARTRATRWGALTQPPAVLG